MTMGGSTDSESMTYDARTGVNVPEIAIWLVFVVIFLDTIGATISTPALPYYAQRFGCSPQEIGYLFGAWSLTSTCGAPILGRLADKYGRRTVLLWSLLGAGSAALAQGFATSYGLLLFARGFSGMWAAVGSTAQVYLADACSPEVLPTYLARLSAVPGLAMIFGPGLGGGLSKFGLNVPIIVDGGVSFFAAILVFFYLPESAAWKREKASSKKHEESPLNIESGKPAPLSEQPSTGWSSALVLLCLSQLTNGVTFGTLVSMLALALDEKLGFDALRVGYTFVGLALAMVISAVWVTPRVQAKIGVHRTALAGTWATAVALACFGFTTTVPTALAALAFSRVAQSMRGAAFGAIVVEVTTVSNRAVILGRVQMFLNCGRLIGPLVGGYIATAYGSGTVPWIFAALSSVISAIFLLLASPTPTKEIHERPGIGARGFSTLRTEEQAHLEDESGEPCDAKELGEWLATLLAKRHYRWVTHKEGVKELIEKLLPELSTDSCEHVRELDKIVKNAAILTNDSAMWH